MQSAYQDNKPRAKKPEPATVAAAQCRSYDPTDLARVVSDLLNALGGVRQLLGNAQKVLIKPNLLTDRAPDAAVTTHPEVVRPLIREFKKAGATVTVADSPANVTKIEQVWDKTGFSALCREEDIELVNLEKAGVQHVGVGTSTLPIARPVLDADLIVNVPKVKTHVLTTLTGAVKNLYGTIPGFRKATMHKDRHMPRDFAEVIAALYRILKPQLSVADGIVGMDGEGPSNGTPYPMGLVLASTDAAAMDTTLCGLMGIPVKRVPYLAALAGSGDIPDVNATLWIGNRAQSIPAPKLPRTAPLHLIPNLLVRAIDPLIWIRPTFGQSCKFCGRCVAACPAAALSQNDRELPTLLAAKCIACCCCHEVCPSKAVTMNLSPLLRFFRGGSLS